MLKEDSVACVEWLGDSLNAVKTWGAAAKQRAGYELYQLQTGCQPSDWRPMRAIGPGAREIRIHLEKEYRIIYVVKVQDTVHVLHAFIKKSTVTKKADIEKARERYKQAVRELEKRSEKRIVSLKNESH